MTHRFALGVGLAVVTAATVLAQTGPAPAANAVNGAIIPPLQRSPQLPWSGLSASEKQALKPLESKWDTIDGAQQRKWRKIAERYHKATPEQQQRMHERMQAWVTLTPEQRRLARENYQAVKKVDPATRANKWNSYEQLPAEKRIEMHTAVEEQRKASRPNNKPRPAVPAGAQPKAAAVTLPPPQAGNPKPRVIVAPGLVDQKTLLPAAQPLSLTDKQPPATGKN